MNFQIPDHTYYVGAQYHPEYLSSPLAPSPPFLGLLLAASEQLDVRILSIFLKE